MTTTCACGCGQRLAVTGPSPWYATPECQDRWNDRQVTRPDDVYRQLDAVTRPPAANWRPGLVGDVDDELEPAPDSIARLLAYSPDSDTGYYGVVAWNITRRAWRLRLDDGNRWVALHLDPAAHTNPTKVSKLWRKLECQLLNKRLAETAAMPHDTAQEVIERALIRLDSLFAPRAESPQRLTFSDILAVARAFDAAVDRVAPTYDLHDRIVWLPFAGGPLHRQFRAVPGPPQPTCRLVEQVDFTQNPAPPLSFVVYYLRLVSLGGRTASVYATADVTTEEMAEVVAEHQHDPHWSSRTHGPNRVGDPDTHATLTRRRGLR